ncbi:MAG TPA: cupin domain-containing protein [Sedimentibacter sp.]|nr:cupin domain-containing protein [Sedimentibacter sp.]
MKGKQNMYNYDRSQHNFMTPSWQNDCYSYLNPYSYFFSQNFRPEYFEQMTNQYNPHYPIDNMPYVQNYDYSQNVNKGYVEEIKDYGKEPYVVNINEITKQNNNYRSALWTGDHLQLTLMSIPVGGDIGLEVHPNADQFLRIEEGQGTVTMGDSKDNLTYRENVYDDYAIFIPMGKWHNVVNTGRIPLKMYSIYAPPLHPKGVIQKTKEEAHAAK